jgi:hypothetical protein
MRESALTGSLPLVPEALGAGRKLRLDYVDNDGRRSARAVWPVALAFCARILAAWCETRQAFRHFRLDRWRQSQSWTCARWRRAARCYHLAAGGGARRVSVGRRTGKIAACLCGDGALRNAAPAACRRA